MLTRIRLLLIHVTLVSIYLSSVNHVAGTTNFVGVVQNLSVEAFQGNRDIDSNDIYKFLKLNISWLPPNGNRQPSSYSVTVTGILAEKIANVDCPDGSIYYTSSNNKQLYVLLPKSTISVDVPELYIKHNCSYKVQVIANPRTKHRVDPAEVLYTVPECIGLRCSCESAKSKLPIPKVNITWKENQLVVHWNTTNITNVHSYIISVGVPLLTSKKGLLVYNVTRIGQVSVKESIFSWNLKSNNQYTDVKNGYKIAVNAVNDHGCFGIEGNVTIHSVSSNFETGNSKWLILIGIMGTCVLFGTLSFIVYRNINLFISNHSNNSRVHTISKCKSEWAEAVLQKQNILYVQPQFEEECKKETDKLQMPFKSVKLLHELGNGQFGKVYLGHLDDTNHTLVAVKTSQHVDASTVSEIRRQFLEEIEMMRMAGFHPHLVNLIGYCIQPGKPVCILLEYMQGGDLLTYLRSKRKSQRNKIILEDKKNVQSLSKPSVSETLYTTLSSTTSIQDSIYTCKHTVTKYVNIPNNSDDRRDIDENSIGKIERQQFLKFAMEIAMGMEHLETRGITHRDLAARNILLSTDSTVKISDFGLSRNGVYVIQNTKGKARQLPIRWMSPEALRDRAFSSKSDVWAFGVVLWEIGTLGSFPYPNIQDDRLLRYIIHENGRLEHPDGVPSDIYQLMSSCWATEPNNRPNFTQLLSTLRIIIASSDITSASNPCYGLSD